MKGSVEVEGFSHQRVKVATVEIEAGTRPVEAVSSNAEPSNTSDEATGEADLPISAFFPEATSSNISLTYPDVHFRQRFVRDGARLKSGETFLTVIRSVARIAPDNVDAKVTSNGFLYADQELGVTVKLAMVEETDEKVRWADVLTALIGMVKAMVSVKKIAEFEGEFHSSEDAHRKEVVYARIKIEKYGSEHAGQAAVA